MTRALLCTWAAALLVCSWGHSSDGDATGPFHPPVAYRPGGTVLTSPAVADIIGDAAPDLLVVARAQGRVEILPATGAGTFGPALPVEAGSDPLRTTAGDVDGDGVADLIAIGHFDNGFLVRRGLGGGRLGSPVSYPLRNHGRQIVVTDLNRDGFDDVVAAHDGSGQPIYVTVFLGSRSGAMEQVWEHPTPYFASKNIVFGDFDGNGQVDFALGAGDNRVALLLFHGLGTGAFRTPVTFPPLTETPGAADGNERLAAADLNADGFTDLVVAHRYLKDMLAIRLGSTAGLGTPSLLTLPVPGDVVLGDLDGDDVPDAVVSHPEAAAISVLRGIGDGSLRAPETLSVGNQPEGLVLADLNGDGSPDLVVTDLSEHRIHVLLNRRARGGPRERRRP